MRNKSLTRFAAFFVVAFATFSVLFVASAFSAFAIVKFPPFNLSWYILLCIHLIALGKFLTHPSVSFINI